MSSPFSVVLKRIPDLISVLDSSYVLVGVIQMTAVFPSNFHYTAVVKVPYRSKWECYDSYKEKTTSISQKKEITIETLLYVKN